MAFTDTPARMLTPRRSIAAPLHAAAQKQARYECFAEARVPDGIYFAIRADGHRFHALTSRLTKPYDERFRTWLNEAVRSYLLRRFCLPFFVFSFSDEVSLVFRKEDDLHARRVEKLDSLIAAGLSASLTHRMRVVAFFDARIIALPRFGDVVRYLAERQAEARRDCINAYTFYTLVHEGLTPEQAGEAMRGWRFRRMHRYLREHKIMFGRLPLWQRRGEAFYWEAYAKPGWNPLTGRRTVAKRFGLVRNEALPHFPSRAGRRLLCKALEARRLDPDETNWSPCATA